MTRHFLLPMALLLAACSPKSGNDAEALKQASRDWSAAAERGDMARVLSYFADDAVIIADGRPPIRGRDAIRAYLAETATIPGFAIRWKPLEATVSGDIGYLLERTRITMNGPDGSPLVQELQAVTIWRRQPDGSWKAAVDITTGAPPAR